MRPFHNWSRTCLRLVLPLAPALVFALPVFAADCRPFGTVASCPQTDPGGLADTAEPGSLLVFPKFMKDTVVVDPTTSGGQFPQTIPKSEFEIGAVCPLPVPVIAGTGIPQRCVNTVYNVTIHWVCPGVTQGQVGSVCPENDFIVAVSTNGKVVFNPTGFPARNGQVTGYSASSGASEGGKDPVPPAPCDRGYMIAYTSDSTELPFKHDVLIGDAVLRNTVPVAFPLNGQDLKSYSALAIQGDPNAPDGSAIRTGNDSGFPTLVFDGNPGSAPGAPTNHYQTVAGQIQGDIRFTQDDVPPFADTQLILLTLDVRSNLLPNSQTSVALDFYNQTKIGIRARAPSSTVGSRSSSPT